MKATRTQRLIRLVQTLQTGRQWRVEALALEMNVSRRTVFRDMQVLREAGISCTYDADTERYRVDHSSYLPPLNLSLPEALALMLLTRKFVDERVIPSASAAIAAGLKIESALPREIRSHCGALLENVDVGAMRVSDADAVLDVMLRIQEAAASRYKVHLRYDSYFEKQEISTVLYPYTVTFRGRGWYVVGFSEMHAAVRTFKLERIVELDVSSDMYPPPRDFDIDEYFGNAWHMIRGQTPYHVEIHFSPKVAGNVEEVAWHPTQRTRRRLDGGLVFEVDVDGIDEISWWVLGYGDQAIVCEPEPLRALIAARARAMTDQYESNAEWPAVGG